MPSVLIVEDESAAGRYLRSVIELKRPDFTVLGVAENGAEGLVLARKLNPDLVVTDVRMPVMDGIEFVMALKKEFPTLPAIIVSGFQEFEYARRALNTGVVDYLLKPVNPAKLAEVLDRLATAIARRADERRARILQRRIRGDCFGAGEADAVPEDEEFWFAAVRSGGLPSRFRLDTAEDEGAAVSGGLFDLPGRDRRERFRLGAKAALAFDEFAKLATGGDGGEGGAGGAGGDFRTTLILTAALPSRGLQAGAREACLNLDRLIVAGLSQVRHGWVKPVPVATRDAVLADRMDFALRGNRTDLLERAIREAAETWEKERLPLIAVESRLRQLVHFVLGKTPRPNGAVAANLESLLEDALAEARDFRQLSDAAWSLIAEAAGAGSAGSAGSARSGEFRDTDVPSFFRAITRYVEERYAEPLNLAALSETFRISPSYLSKLFRQHADRSFGEFLTATRIEAAKRLIRGSPSIPLKDVGECSGFPDPYFFSRVFKTVVGVAPSEYSRTRE